MKLLGRARGEGKPVSYAVPPGGACAAVLRKVPAGTAPGTRIVQNEPLFNKLCWPGADIDHVSKTEACGHIAAPI